MNTTLRALRNRWLLFGITISLSGFSFVTWCVIANQAGNKPDKRQDRLEQALNPNGTLKAGLKGSFDATGYRMENTTTGAPRFVPTVMQASCNGWDTQFSLPNGTDNTVFSLAVSGADLYVGGTFTSAGNLAVNRVAKFNTMTNTWSALGSGSGNGVNGRVLALAVIGTDLYVGGSFTVANLGGASISANRIARFNTMTNTWNSIGSGVSGISGDDFSIVNTLLANGNELYLGGNFAVAGGVAANSVAKFNTLSNTWEKLGSDSGNGVKGSVKALAITGNDLYIGGYFYAANVGGLSVSANNVVKFNLITNTWSALGTGSGNGVNTDVWALATNGNELYVGGSLTSANIGGFVITVNNLAKYNISTGSWSALGTEGGNGVNGGVLALTMVGSDLYVGGFFKTANIGGPVVGTSLVAKFNTLTNSWGSFSANGETDLTDAAFALAISGKDLYVGGSFYVTTVIGVDVGASRIAKFDTASNRWSLLSGNGGNGGNAVNASVTALTIIGNDIYVGGWFTSVGNIRANRLAKFNTLTNTWSVLGNGGGNGVNGPIHSFVTIGSDLYIGGEFTSANIGGPTIRASNIIKFNTLTHVWSPLGVNGGNGVGGYVYCLATIGNDLYVGGNFSSANNNGTSGISARRLAKFNTLTSTWSALGTNGGDGLNSSVYALAASGSNLYVGGSFYTVNVGGPTINANRVAKLDTLTGIWSALGKGGGNGVSEVVFTLAVIESDLYVGGYFQTSNVGGLSVSTSNIAKFSIPTNSWSPLNIGGGNGFDGIISALAVRGNDLFLAGSFTKVNRSDVSANRVAKINIATGALSVFAEADGSNGVSGPYLNALALKGNDLYVGGQFNIVRESKVSGNIGRFCSGSAAPTIESINATRMAGGIPVNSLIGIINDADQAANTLSVTVNGLASATINGVNLSNIHISNTGEVSASITAALNATTANFALRVTDGAGAFSEATLAVNVVRLSGDIGAPLVCLGPGSTIKATLVLGNPNNTPLSVSDATTFTNLVGVTGSCLVTPNVGTCTVTGQMLTYLATLAQNQTVTITYLLQVVDGLPPGAQVCTNNRAQFGENSGTIGPGGITFENSAPPLSLQVCGTVNCPPAGPGALPQVASPLSDQKAGSVLIYNIYTSATDPTRQNTRLSITNTDPARAANVHLFFVDGASCSVADSFLCLTPNQTMSFLAGDLDPGTTGYMVAVATDALGCPVNFNFLIGDEYVKFASGHAANLGAEAIAALAGGRPACDQNASTAQLRFDGLSYNRVPRVLALDNLPSRADGNDTLLILNRIGGNLGLGAATLGTIFGILHNDAEASLSFSLSGGCQLRGSISNSFPRTAPRFENFVPAGRSGWMKFYSQDTDIGILGATINFNSNAATNAGAFNQGHNLHALTNTSAMSYVIPILPPNC